VRGHRTVKVDKAQADIVAALLRMGAKAVSTSIVGSGFGDLVVGFRGKNVCLEVKNPGPPSEQALTAKEADFHATWPGQIHVVSTPEEACRVVAEAARPAPACACTGEPR
jgi:hypothetical protein